MQKRTEHEQDHPLAHCSPGTISPPRPKWKILEFLPAVIPFPIQEPLRIKCRRVIPNRWVPLHCPHIDKDWGVLWNRVASDDKCLAWGAAADEREDWMQMQSLFHYCFQVG
ncbi:hypothetical protein RHMOL_Rhmol07G0121200 [Rhododendron molle]|uniref:Uncharacterized protein n=1 Tax=Rhododendron molle TaxID=49168 RepID=A0ACC0N0G3_RHOML|nr:hypothetical protein RHMOL_Rhmol07G0121200 [Rhododendron molle]